MPKVRNRTAFAFELEVPLFYVVLLGGGCLFFGSFGKPFKTTASVQPKPAEPSVSLKAFTNQCTNECSALRGDQS